MYRYLLDYLISKVRYIILQQILKAHITVSFHYIYNQLGYRSQENCYKYLFNEHKCVKIINTNDTSNNNTFSGIGIKRSYSEVTACNSTVSITTNTTAFDNIEINCKTSVLISTC